jgi:hypothetical protein
VSVDNLGHRSVGQESGVLVAKEGRGKKISEDVGNVILNVIREFREPHTKGLAIMDSWAGGM